MMKKTVIALMLLTLCLASQAQEKYAYCELTTQIKGGKFITFINFGDDSPYNDMPEYKDASGKPLTFTSHIDAINFMSKKGWELVLAYSSGEGAVKNYILRRETT